MTERSWHLDALLLPNSFFLELGCDPGKERASKWTVTAFQPILYKKRSNKKLISRNTNKAPFLVFLSLKTKVC